MPEDPRPTNALDHDLPINNMAEDMPEQTRKLLDEFQKMLGMIDRVYKTRADTLRTLAAIEEYEDGRREARSADENTVRNIGEIGLKGAAATSYITSANISKPLPPEAPWLKEGESNMLDRESTLALRAQREAKWQIPYTRFGEERKLDDLVDLNQVPADQRDLAENTIEEWNRNALVQVEKKEKEVTELHAARVEAEFEKLDKLDNHLSNLTMLNEDNSMSQAHYTEAKHFLSKFANDPTYKELSDSQKRSLITMTARNGGDFHNLRDMKALAERGIPLRLFLTEEQLKTPPERDISPRHAALAEEFRNQSKQSASKTNPAKTKDNSPTDTKSKGFSPSRAPSPPARGSSGSRSGS